MHEWTRTKERTEEGLGVKGEGGECACDGRLRKYTHKNVKGRKLEG